MRIIQTGKTRRRLIPAALIAAFLLLLLAGGLGFFRMETLRSLRRDPVGTVQAPFRSALARLTAAELPVFRVDMKFKYYEQIMARREDALRQGILQTSDTDLVPATLDPGDGPVRVRMRLKGDWPDHFKGDKWSYRIETRKDGQIWGMRRFSLQHPASREYLAEWAFLGSMRREDILAPRYDFVRLVFNGDEKGIMALEEHFAKELLESQGRREGPIAKFDEAPLWEQRRITLAERGLEFSALDQLNYRGGEVTFFGKGKIAENPVLTEQAVAARHLLEGFRDGRLSGSQVFDPVRMPRYLALCRLWGADHALIWHNLRFYYNPVTTKLEPIAFDGEPSAWLPEHMWRTDIMKGFELRRGYGGWFDWIEALLDDPIMAERYLQELHRVSEPSYVDSLHEALAEDHARLRSALLVEWPALADPFVALGRGRSFVYGKLRPLVSIQAQLLPPRVRRAR